MLQIATILLSQIDYPPVLDLMSITLPVQVPRPMLENYLRQLFAIGDAKHEGLLPPHEISDLLSRSGEDS